MPRQVQNSIQNNLSAGLVTEYGALSFPPTGATATENCIWTQKKTVRRRFGFNLEAGFSQLAVTSPFAVIVNNGL